MAVMSRIAREDVVTHHTTDKLVRAKSVVDEDASVLLLSQAFNEIFRLFDNVTKPNVDKLD